MSAYEHMRNKPPVTRAQEKLYRNWRAYLRNSKLTEPEQHRRASQYADMSRPVPKDQS